MGEVITAELISSSDLELNHAYEELVEASRFVAHLSGCDGAILISDDLNVLGFGVEIAAEPRDGTPVGAVDNDFEEVNHKFRQLDVEHFGMRHRSALKLVTQEPNWRALVVSQDGPISAVWSMRWTVVFRRGVNLVNMNMPWA
jgi:hypothetical protein